MDTVSRPWGTYQTLYDGEDCKVKRIVVNPDQSPSYQFHFKRSECWVVISGTGYARLEDRVIRVEPGTTLNVPKESKHTIVNDHKIDPLVFIEIQTGTYFGEDDIVRIEDKYGRA